MSKRQIKWFFNQRLKYEKKNAECLLLDYHIYLFKIKILNLRRS